MNSLIHRLGLCLFTLLAAGLRSETLPTLEEAVASKRDLWGLAAMRQPNGASYEFFENLLPPPRYVNADFRHYPIVLSAPRSLVKARLISNGSGVNLPGGARSWRDVGTPFTFRVGPDEFIFGGLADRLAEPTLADGFLPIVEIQYRHPSPVQSEGRVPLRQEKLAVTPEIYRLEAFAGTTSALGSNGVIFVKFDLAQGTNGFVTVQASGTGLRLENGWLAGEAGVVACFDPRWKWERGLVVTRLRPGESATMALATKALSAGQALQMSKEWYDSERQACADTWRQVLAPAMNVQVPEGRVNDAWRALLIQNFGLMQGDRIHYSFGNQYDKLYESEGSDAAMAMLGWGYDSEVRRMVVPLLDFTRKDLECHQAGFKLNNLCRYYWQTRDAGAIRDLRPRWEKEMRLLADHRTNEVGLCPKQQYCGDISTMVYSLSANAKAWRALRDFSVLLSEVGATAEARRYSENAAQFRAAVLTAIEKSIRRETSPPFVPIALYADEPAHDPITEKRIGSYWNIVIGYVIGSGIFPPGSEQESWIARYQEEHGGILMGMVRSGGAQFNFWSGSQRINPLYGTRYALDTLMRDDPERAIVSLYGMLAQGFTRNTFICGEGCTLDPVDERGRFFYCPPNSAANAHFLAILRGILVQDWDLDNDGTPETLRLGFATPRRWLEDGKTIRIERAPTAFGPVSITLESRIAKGEVLADLQPPLRTPPRSLLMRARVPNGLKVVSASSGQRRFAVDPQGTIDVTGVTNRMQITFTVAPQ